MPSICAAGLKRRHHFCQHKLGPAGASRLMEPSSCRIPNLTLHLGPARVAGRTDNFVLGRPRTGSASRPRSARFGAPLNIIALQRTIYSENPSARRVKRRSGRNLFVFDDGIAATKTERPRKPESPRSPPRELLPPSSYCLSSQKCQKASACCC